MEDALTLQYADDPKRYWSMFLDFDSFFAHVEKQDDERLWERPVAVSPTKTRHSGVIACCYAAKALGVKRGMRPDEAQRLAPNIVFRHARHEVYIQKHALILAAIEKFIPVETAWSVDEMSIDLKRMHLSDAIELVKNIKAELAAVLGPLVTASFGIAQTGLLAKIAAEANKPDGLVIFHPDEMPERLYEIELEDIPGIACGMLVRLRRAGVTTTEGLLALQPKHVRKIWGSVEGERVWRALQGQHTERPKTKRSMFGHSRVLARSWRTPEKGAECLRILCAHAARRLRAEGYFAKRMTVGFKTGGKARYGLQREFPAVRDDFALQKIAAEIYAVLIAQAQTRVIIQVSISLSAIVKEAELVDDLFAESRHVLQTDKAVRAMDAINKKYEKSVLKIGATESLPGGYDGVKIAFGRIPDAADIYSASKLS